MLEDVIFMITSELGKPKLTELQKNTTETKLSQATQFLTVALYLVRVLKHFWNYSGELVS